MLGLISDEIRNSIEPDYTLSEINVYGTAVNCVLRFVAAQIQGSSSKEWFVASTSVDLYKSHHSGNPNDNGQHSGEASMTLPLPQSELFHMKHQEALFSAYQRMSESLQEAFDLKEENMQDTETEV